MSIVDYAGPAASGPLRYTGEVRSVKVAWKTAGRNWTELPISLLLDERGHPEVLGHLESGLLYRADLSALSAGPIDLRIEMDDLSGNASVVTFNGTFVVGGRRRVVRK